MNYFFKLLSIAFLGLISQSALAQSDSSFMKPREIGRPSIGNPSKNQGTKGPSSPSTPTPVASNDTVYQRTLPNVIITDTMRARTALEEEQYQRLKRKVIKLYPYALLAKQIYETSNQDLSKMGSNKDARKYKKEKEKELRTRFEDEIKGLYTTDGPVLVKLIYRETGKTTYDILKDIKGGFNSFFYQFTAKRYGYSLKDTYDPNIDTDIESVVQILKAEGQLPIYAPK